MLRLVFFLLILGTQGETAFLVSDSGGFLQLAQNILAGEGFSQSRAGPFLPSAHFPPLYPLLLAGSLKISSSLLPVIILQIVLGAILPFLVYKIGFYFSGREGMALMAAGFMALEPTIAIFNLLAMTDTVAVFFLILGGLFFIKIFLDKSVYKYATLAGVCLGLSTLAKPNAQLLGILGFIFLITWFILSQKHARNSLVPGLLFLVSFLVVLSPWLVRNTIQFGTPMVSATGLRNLYTDFAVSVISFDTGKSYGEVEEELERDFAIRYGVASSEVGNNPLLGTTLAKEGLKITLARPRASLSVLAITLETFFTQDLYAYYSQKFYLTAPATFDFSPSVTLFKEGPWILAQKVWQFAGISAIIPLAGRLLWVFLTLWAAYGTYLALRRGGQERVLAFSFAAIILYYAATSAVAAFSDQGRHRYPADAFIFILASYGISNIYLRYFSKESKNKTEYITS